jgi:hypothetical protein
MESKYRLQKNVTLRFGVSLAQVSLRSAEGAASARLRSAPQKSVVSSKFYFTSASP